MVTSGSKIDGQQTEVLVIGAGLAGLALAERLHNHGVDYLVLEARDRAGGRILTASVDGHVFDLGPTWFWPGQSRMESLVARLGLRTFEQYATGDNLFEDGQGRLHRGIGFVSMAGACRLDGGIGALIEGLIQRIDPTRLETRSPVTRLTRDGDTLLARIDGRDAPIRARRVVLTMPPRIAAATVSFEPPLSEQTLRTMSAIPTWMAGHAKAVVVYEQPHWRAAGLSGDAASHRGPLAEIHDASSTNGGHALFGFLSLAPELRIAQQRELADAVVAQLVRLFGPEMATPLSVEIQDWAREPWTACVEDQQALGQHPAYGLPRVLSGCWDGRLLFGSSEVAPRHGGLLEGALESAARVFGEVTR